MYSFHKSHDIYYTDNSFYSSHSFPIEWIESFKRVEEINEDFNKEEDIKYKPIMGEKEIFKDNENNKRYRAKAKIDTLHRKSEMKSSVSEMEEVANERKVQTARSKKRVKSKKMTTKFEEEFIQEFIDYSENKKDLPAESSRTDNKELTHKRTGMGCSKNTSQSSTEIANTIINYLNEHKIINKQLKRTSYN